MSINSRALHYVLKVADLKKNILFFRDRLKMKVLRHEVFDEGCEAACNGPYSNKWSKTMIGYGPEDNHFVLELTYNYSVGYYALGNDLQHIRIALAHDVYNEVSKDCVEGTNPLVSPDGYKFYVHPRTDDSPKSDITEVCLACSNLEKSIEYWVKLLNMSQVTEPTDNQVQLRYKQDQATLTLKLLDQTIDHKTAYGRIAFSCPSDDLKPIQTSIEEKEHKVLTPYLSLETPGKATVQVVILADPDGHEICFVGDEGFRELSKFDPKANELVEKSMADDKSDEWFQKKGLSKVKS